MADLNFVYMTRERLNELERDLKRMKTEGRRDIADKIATARAHGDLSENAEYDAAKEEQEKFEIRLAKLESTIQRAKIIDESQFADDETHILSHVKVKNLNSKKEFTYQLVSPEEADFKAGKIAVTSPVGAGLLGKKVGEKVKVQAPAGAMQFEILAIE
ncbi:MAG: transcription elongation factor GreA [Ignavibacteriales bacterium]|jgi:transcription elongation factor GreA|nr:transcription elongation factor GreA [Ignavibacteriales bacterium]